MSPTGSLPDPLRSYAEQYCDGTLSADHTAALEQRLCDDPRAMEFFVLYMEIHSQIAWDARARSEGNEQNAQRGLGTSVPSEASIALPIPDLTVPHSSFLIPHSFSPPSFVGGVLFSYLVATLILGTALAIAWAWKLPDYTQVARQSVPRPSPLAPRPSSGMRFVGRITGMVDCQWADPNTAVPGPVAVPLGRKYALSSGLMEITYDTGARVILQGPATYEVESATGGYLSLGKLTARLEKKAEGGGQRAEESNPQSPIPNPPSLSTAHYPLFTIKTPTAVVTDLGTEFGVEVQPDREEDVVVFQGQVRVAVCGRQGDVGQARILQAGQSAQINGKTATFVVANMPAESKRPFVRTLYAAAALSPADVAASDHLVLWLKADAIRGLGDGEPLGVWHDSSGRRNHMYQAAATLPVYVAGASSGLNKMPVVRFDGSQQLCGVLDTDPSIPGTQPLNTPFTLFSVVRNTDSSGSHVVRGYFGGGDLRMAFGMSRLLSFGPPNSFWLWAPNVLCTLGQADSLNTDWNIHAYTLDDSAQPSWRWQCNGTAVGSSGLTSETPQPYGEIVFVGSSGHQDEHWVGDVAEILLYNRVLTGPELNQVGSYLGRKYGIDVAWVDPKPAVDVRPSTATPQEALPMKPQ